MSAAEIGNPKSMKCEGVVTRASISGGGSNNSQIAINVMHNGTQYTILVNPQTKGIALWNDSTKSTVWTIT